MIPAISVHHVYYEHDSAAAFLVASAQEFTKECREFAAAETGGIPVGVERLVGRMEVICKAVESSFLRGYSAYDVGSIRDLAEELRESNERLQRHMPGRYVNERDPCGDRYEHGASAMAIMNDLYESALELLAHEGQRPTPQHIKAVRVEMCWHIRALFERGTDVIAETWRLSRQSC